MAKIKVFSGTTKKDVILRNAAALFRRKGFRASSMRELAVSLGIEAPSLYNHIGSKAELLQEICFETAKDFSQNMQAVIQSGKPAPEKIADIIRFHLHKTFNDFDKVLVADSQWKELKKAEAAGFLAQRRAYEDHVTDIIAEGVRKKRFRKLNPRITMFTILAAVRGLELRQKNKNEFSLQELEENMIQHLLNGITL